MTAHEPQQRPRNTAARKPTPKTPMSELLASCAAAAAVSNPPADIPHAPEEPALPAQRPERGAA